MPPPIESPLGRFEPVCLHHTLLDGSWWPESADLGAELPALVPILDRHCGPVVRLLLGAAGWANRPTRIRAADHTVSVGYLAEQSPSMMTVLCADGGMFSLCVAPPERESADVPIGQWAAR